VRQESARSEGPRPRRFRVGFIAYGEKPVTYTVSTWFDELMAVALASSTHADRHPRSPINSLFVDEIDPLPSSDVKVIPDGEVVNLNEWR
jgi:hypothetical protein